jgi:methionyl-tRNA formyltransferase
MSVVFLGTPEFAVPSLEHLVSAGFDIAAVYTQPDRAAGRGRKLAAPPVKLAAQRIGLPVFQPPSLRDPDALAALRSLTAEAFVAVAFGQILRPEVLEIPPKGVLNVHPSLLPRWRGASPIPSAILAGDNETGVSIMLMDEGLDSGPILAQERCEILEDDSALTLGRRLAEQGGRLLASTLRDWIGDRITPKAQDATLVTTTRLLKKEDGRIDWRRPAVEIWRAVRAFNPWPSAHTSLKGEFIRIWRARPLDAASSVAPGEVVGCSPSDIADEAAFAVQTGDGLLAVLEIQREGKKALPSAEFLRGMPGLIGMRFDPV